MFFLCKGSFLGLRNAHGGASYLSSDPCPLSVISLDPHPEKSDGRLTETKRQEPESTMNDEARQPPPPALDPALFEALGKRVVADIAGHLATLRERPIRPTPPETDLGRTLYRSLPEEGRAPEEIVAAIERDVLPYPTGNGHPGFLAWVVAPPAPVAVLADLMATGMNMMGGGAAPLPTNLSHCVCRWLMELIGFPVEGSMGLLVGGGSMANLTGLAVARHWAAKRDGWNLREEGLQAARPTLVLYASDEAHSCIQKSVELLGLGNANLRRLPTDGDYRLDMAALREAIAADRAAGHRPFCVVGNAGTVNTGAVDPLDEIAELCAAEALWFHIDGAYGALGVCDPEAAPRFTGMERADSLALDPHKWLSVPLDCGCVLVRDRRP
jgi:glutamate/tyrosine decarboxylase-like PLP-dependent enzyme